MFVSYSLNPGNSTGRSDASRCFFSMSDNKSARKASSVVPSSGATGDFRAAIGMAAAPQRGANPSFFPRCRSESGRAERQKEGTTGCFPRFRAVLKARF